MRATKEEQLTVSLEEGLQRQQGPSLDANSPHTQNVEGLVQPGFRQQFLDPRRFDFRVREFELAHGFTQERRFSRFDFNHCQGQARHRQLQRDRRGTSPRSNVHQPSGGGRYVAGSNQRLEDEPVYRFVWILQRSEIDLLVPARQQGVERRQLLRQVVSEKQPRARGATDQAA